MNQRRELGVFVQNPDPTSPAGLTAGIRRRLLRKPRLRKHVRLAPLP
uniref:Transcription termination factor Rho n=1 Tax=Mesocestoides corti TaxID=53468 RepID=A0A5K3G382_MESCO